MPEESKPPPAERSTAERWPVEGAGLAGRFDLLSELGSGASGTVYRAVTRADYRDLPTGSEVAIKFLRQDRMGDPRAREQLLREGRLGMLLRHRNVARIHGIETLSVLGLELVYLVMELVSGTSLRQFLTDSGPAVEDLGRRIGADAARGLGELHRRGVVHRDVKPENLLLTDAGEIKLVDLGLARWAGASGTDGYSYASGGLVGAVAYAAPEVLTGRPSTPASDLYALGVVLFEAVAGRHPFADCTTVDEMIDAHLRRPPPRLSHFRPRVTPFLEHVVAELLEKEPKARPARADRLARTLGEGEQSVSWRKVTARAPVVASGRRLRQMRRAADAKFFGRREEQQRLDELFQAARSGIGVALCVSGPRGMGRRRLLDECLSRWLDQHPELLLLGGEANRAADVRRGSPFCDMLRDELLGGDAEDSPQVAARLSARIRALPWPTDDVQPLAAAITGESDEPAEVRADLLARALSMLAERERVLVLRIDLADRLDTTGRLVLERLLDRVGKLRLLVLLVAGPDGLPELPCEELRPRGLAEADFLALGRALFARDGDETVLRNACATLSGSPGNLIDALAHLAQGGVLAGKPGSYRAVAPLAEIRPPPPYLERLAARVGELPPSQRHVLQAAAILGRQFELAVLTALVGQTQLVVLEALSVFDGRVLRVVGGEVAFRHRDFRAALLRTVPREHARRLHRAAAWVLEDRGAAPFVVGLHLSRAGEDQACLEPLLDGLEQLIQAGSRRTSRRIAGRLRVHLQRVADDPDNRRRRLRHALLGARVWAPVGQTKSAQAALLLANRLGHELGDVLALGQAQIGLAELAGDAGRLLTAIGLLEQTHALLAERDDAEGRRLAAHAHAVHGGIAMDLGQADEARTQLREALRTAPVEDVDLGLDLFIDLARAEALRYRFAAALKILAGVERDLRGRRAPRTALRLHLYRGRIGTILDDPRAATELRVAEDEAQQLSLPRYRGRAALYRGEAELWRRRREPARNRLRAARNAALDAGDRLTAVQAAALLAGLGEARDDLEGLVGELGVPAVSAVFLVAEADRHEREGRPEMVRVCADEAMDLVRENDVPLQIHLRVLRRAGRDALARAVVRSVAAGLPAAMRRRFSALANR